MICDYFFGRVNTDYQHYRILEREDGQPWELGHGAMGLTFKAEDLNLRCPVALKIISPHLVDSRQAREFFLAEARGAASLRHRNVAAVHHLGTHKDSFFYVMEFVEGETVDTIIRRQGRLETAVALDIAQQTACALAAAGRRGLVHRDIKPANLMLTDEGDGTLVVKVIDFGLCKSLRGVAPKKSIARKIDSSAGDSSDGSGFLGTPHFASPEQIRNLPDVDGRADFYSLGASLWQMLVGRPPFTGSVDAVRGQHLADPPPFAQLPADLPEAVRTLLARLLEKDPARRPQTPAELIDAIEGAVHVVKGTANLNTTWKTQGCVPLVGTVLKHNFHLEAVVTEDGAVANGSVFRAEDLHGQRLVSIRLLDRARPLDPVRNLVARLAAAPHPNIVRDETLSSCRDQPFLVSEWISGFPLANVLRARGALSAGEAQPLIHQAARAVDHARLHGLGRLDLRLDAAFVHFFDGGNDDPLEPVALRALASVPLGEWPACLLKLRLLDETSASSSGIADEPVCALGHFAAELLGSNAAETIAFSALEKAQRLQLPGVPRPISDLVGRAVSVDSGFSSGTEFAEALTEAGRSA